MKEKGHCLRKTINSSALNDTTTSKRFIGDFKMLSNLLEEFGKFDNFCLLSEFYLALSRNRGQASLGISKCCEFARGIYLV